MDEVIKVSELQSAHELMGDEIFIINQSDTKITKTKKATMKAILEFMQSSIDGVVNKYVPPGSIYAYAGKVNKIDQLKGWLLCNGERVRKSKYPILYSVIKDIYTPDNVKATKDFFYLPNLIGRSVMGFCANKSFTPTTNTSEKWIGEPISLSQKIGFYSIKLTQNQMAAHAHGDSGHIHKFFDYFKIYTEGPFAWGHDQSGNWHFQFYPGNEKAGLKAIEQLKAGLKIDDTFYTNTKPTNVVLQTVGGSLFHNNMQPSIALNYIIKI